MKGWVGSFLVVAASLLCASPALALGPVDIELSAAYWDATQDFNFAAGGSIDHFGDGNVMFDGKLSRGKWSLDVTQANTELESGLFPGSGRTTDFLIIDFRRRIAEFSEGNYFAIGLGWQQIDVSYAGLPGSADTSGLRLSAELRTNLAGVIQGYGELGFFPSMDDMTGGPGLMAESVEGYDYEVGVLIRLAPYLKLKVGYRIESLESDGGADNPAPWTSWETTGMLYGLTARF
jgi:hypothetical protein